MLNSLQLYADAGRKAAQARNQRDESRAAFNEDWLRRALALEQAQDRRVARAAFDAAYREARALSFT